MADPNDNVTIPLTERVNEAQIHLKRRRWTKTTHHDINVKVFRYEAPAAETEHRMVAEQPSH